MKRDYGTAMDSRMMKRGDGSVHYDTNVVCRTSFDNGVTQNGAHGRFAKFSDTRTQPIVGNTDNYTMALVRASIKTDEIPLFVARPSALITENGTQYWECTAQPGISLTWTGPVYSANKQQVLGPQETSDWLYAAWPNYGWIPWYTTCTNLTGADVSGYPIKSGAINLAAIGVSSDTLATTVASRLQTALATATGITINVTSPTASPSIAMTQQYSIQNNDSFATLYLDFSLPVGTAQTTTSGASKEGILQACKLLGFVPGQVFAVAPGTTVLCPRAYQLGFRSTVNMSTYKTVRWVPEDANTNIPSASDVADNNFTTYFDCYSYDHFLNQVINPTFQRCVYDEYDANVVISEQCLTRQLKNLINGNCLAINQWSPASYSVGNSVVYQGVAYVCQIATSSSDIPSSSINWVPCGASYCNSYQNGKIYLTGDVVTSTYNAGGGSYIMVYFGATATTTGPPPASNVTSANGWSPQAWCYVLAGGLSTPPMLASIGTLAPYVSYNSSTNLFTLNLDSYGYGGTITANVDDGYYGFVDDTLNTQHYAVNAALNDIARDSWGITGTNMLTTPPYVVARRPYVSFDERAYVEVDDYFHQLFGNWPCLRLSYFDPRTQLTTSYIRYVPQAIVAGLNVATPLPLTSTAVSTAGLAATYLPYGRLGGTVPYLYMYPQDYPSVGLRWNSFDAIIVATGNVPIEPDQVAPAYILNDAGQPQTVQTNGNTLKILAELNIKPLANMQTGQEFRNEVLFDPATPVFMALQSGRVFNQFDFQLFLRTTEQMYRPLSLSNGGSANLRWVFQLK